FRCVVPVLASPASARYARQYHCLERSGIRIQPTRPSRPTLTCSAPSLLACLPRPRLSIHLADLLPSSSRRAAPPSLPPPALRAKPPGRMDVEYHEEYVRNSSGVQLFTCGWLPASTSPRALVFLCHGLRHGMQRLHERYAWSSSIFLSYTSFSFLSSYFTCLYINDDENSLSQRSSSYFACEHIQPLPLYVRLVYYTKVSRAVCVGIGSIVFSFNTVHSLQRH
uniref:Serine aminopeptidase S33 domain-containing protein n=1 Tax=Aegilops tauschii subsp. strangulata TaxID=200361 RepID=A0A453CHA2_AEGTS